jgi:hypothetical protein
MLFASRSSRASVLALALLFPSVSIADCFDEAARFHTVNPWILRAIAAQESGFRPGTIVQNTNGTLDRGMLGINSVHLPELARYGVTAQDLMDSCKSTYLGAWHLRRKINKHGNSWKAVGAYHSETPWRRDGYALAVQRIIEYWSKQGIIPG